MNTNRLAYIDDMFSKHPDIFPEDHRDLIKNGIVALGMTPFEAKLAGGKFSYKVITDPEIWPAHSDPLAVMWKQSVVPDNSEIWMFFCNSRQFKSGAEIVFSVRFERGRATEILTMKDHG